MNFSNEFESFATRHLGMHTKAVEGGLQRQLQGFTPYIIEERPMNIASMDVFSRLMMDRIIFMGVGVSNEVANIIQAQLLFLDSVDSSRDIQIYINSPGGSVYAGLGIYDTMQFISADVATICTGMAASMAAVLLCAGAPGKRTALKHARVMIHQPMSGMQGQVTEWKSPSKKPSRFGMNCTKFWPTTADNPSKKSPRIRIVTIG